MLMCWVNMDDLYSIIYQFTFDFHRVLGRCICYLINLTNGITIVMLLCCLNKAKKKTMRQVITLHVHLNRSDLQERHLSCSHLTVHHQLFESHSQHQTRCHVPGGVVLGSCSVIHSQIAFLGRSGFHLYTSRLWQ